MHPDKREVFPLAPEPIVKGDGAKRLLSDVRREHPHLKLVVVVDALASNGPHIKHLKGLGLRFILGAKRADHEAAVRVGGRDPTAQAQCGGACRAQ